MVMYKLSSLIHVNISIPDRFQCIVSVSVSISEILSSQLLVLEVLVISGIDTPLLLNAPFILSVAFHV